MWFPSEVLFQHYENTLAVLFGRTLSSIFSIWQEIREFPSEFIVIVIIMIIIILMIIIIMIIIIMIIIIVILA